MELVQLFQLYRPSDSEIVDQSSQIYEQVLRESRVLLRGNFTRVSVADLECLWRAYDANVFKGNLQTALGPTPIRFSLSRRMTLAAGKTKRFFRRASSRGAPTETVRFEISVSVNLLFQTFFDEDRPITVSGVVCRDRLEAMQRVFEHELVHLSEMLIWKESQCTKPRFQAIARQLFGHREHTHQLITQQERAWTKMGLRVGDHVQFQFEGRRYHGRLNRITRRATVLVEDPHGIQYDDGKRYRKFYVPLGMLHAS